MANFYEPAETQGIFDQASRTLTVNQYDRVFIGFRALSQKESEETTVDASENVILSRVRAGTNAIELEIDTSKPIEFTLTATKEVPMSAVGKDVVKPLTIVVQRGYGVSIPAVGQQKDPAGCWAACLSYFLKIAPGRTERRFEDVLGDFNGVWDSTGFINTNALTTQLASQRARYHLKTERIVPAGLKKLVGRWPLVVGFRHPGGFGHMNVLTAYDSSADLARAMDPWFPNPPGNPFMLVDGQVVFDGTEGDFRFVGGFIVRPLSYFQSAMKSGTIFVAYPEEYLQRMP